MDHEKVYSSKKLHPSNVVNNEIPVNDSGTLYPKLYINHGFDCQKEQLASIPNSNIYTQNDSQMTQIDLSNNNYGDATVNGSTIVPVKDRNNSTYEKNFDPCNIPLNFTNSPIIVDNDLSLLPFTPTSSPISTSLVWNNLSFQVTKKVWKIENGIPMRNHVVKQILKPQNGEIYSGSLTALMGPSGAGKSTLLNCLTGRYVTGVKGEISITCRGPKPKASISFVPQKDQLFMTFTVRETLLFASKMKNLEANVHHEDEALRVMKNLNLECCSEVKVSKCSGGQVKRVCIGVELISNPDILVLDEPTTGLDSSTAAQCIELLRRLCESKNNPPAIVATIHQPNYKIFREFNFIYLLSRNGQNIFFGSPLNIVDHFANYDLICPTYCNPADYAMEVASGQYGQDFFALMEQDNREKEYSGVGRGSKYDLHKVIFKLREKKMPFWSHTLLLTKRNFQHMIRDSNQFWFKNFLSILIALLFSYLWVYKVGEDDGCWDSFNPPINQTELKRTLFKVNITAAKDEYLGKISRIADNSALIFAFNIYTMMIALISCVLAFPLEVSIVFKEIGNNWYRPTPYFYSKIMSDLPPLFISTILLVSIVYPMTGQIGDIWRFVLFYLISCLSSEVCQTIGTFTGILMSNDIVSAALLTVASTMPAIFFAGFLVRASGMPWYFRPMSYISYMRYGFESLLVVIYGFGRCSPTLERENFVEKIISSKEPQKMVKTLWDTFNVSYSDVQQFSSLLKVKENCLGEITNNTADYLGLEYFSPFPTTTTPSPYGFSFVEDEDDFVGDDDDIMDDLEARNPSYILSYFELSEKMLITNIIYLFAYSLIFKLFIYFLLKFKTRSTV